ncbi:nicotinamide-nucleotide amidase [Pseudomonadota bacterium]
MTTDDDLNEIAKALSKQASAAGVSLATAESCTGGWIAKVLTDLPGSSAWLDRGFVTYTNESKQEMLGVQTATLETYGAVSEQTVHEMALGALNKSQASIAVAVSGIAGPSGAMPDKPVGTVCFAWARRDGGVRTCRKQFSGDRDQVRRQAVARALNGIMDLLN